MFDAQEGGHIKRMGAARAPKVRAAARDISSSCFSFHRTAYILIYDVRTISQTLELDGECRKLEQTSSSPLDSVFACHNRQREDLGCANDANAHTLITSGVLE